MLAPNQQLANPLPKPSDVGRILSQTPKAFATAPSNLKRKRIEQPAERLLRAKGIVVYEVPSSQGMVMARGAWKSHRRGRSRHMEGRFSSLISREPRFSSKINGFVAVQRCGEMGASTALAKLSGAGLTVV
ncbi:MAG: hypothetical protein R3F11_22785 [Verrucomicrobiales bacterium]